MSDALNNLRISPEERMRLLEVLVESTSDAIIGLDADHNVVSWNAGAQLMLGYKAEEIVGRSALALVAPERRNRAQENRECLAQGGTLSNYETQLLRKGGQRVQVSLSTSHLKDEAGSPIGYVTIVRDLTESNQAEEALRDTENKLLALYESGVVGVAMGEGDLILDANDALLEMLGYERDELESQGLNWRQITPAEDLYRDEIVLRHALRHGYIEPFEKEYVRKDGSRVPVIVGAATMRGIRPGSSASSSTSPNASWRRYPQVCRRWARTPGFDPSRWRGGVLAPWAWSSVLRLKPRSGSGKLSSTRGMPLSSTPTGSPKPGAPTESFSASNASRTSACSVPGFRPRR